MIYGYIRVSTDQQATTGHSLDAQRAAIEAYCAARSWEPTIYVESGVSAGKALRDRPEGSKLVGNTRKGIAGALKPGDHVIATKLDRLFRNVLDCMTCVEDWRRRDITMHLLDLQIDTSSIGGKLMLQILSAVAEMERGMISERTKAVSQHLRNSGRVYGHTPYGYAREGDRLVPIDEEQHVIRRMRVWRDHGWSLQRISDTINEEGITTKGGKWWSKQSVAIVLRGA